MMDLINRLFGSNKKSIRCPRCLGKGHVDADDIKRLDKELIWRPGRCAYCNARGNVDPSMIEKVDMATTYLTLELSREERQRVIDGNSGAMARGGQMGDRVNHAIQQILYLHVTCQLGVDQITGFFLLP